MLMKLTIKTKNKNLGFTIVELLIVIVVIGILAAITTVAYNGIQKRAQNASIVSEAQQDAKLIATYKALNGDFPTVTPAEEAVCIGTGFQVFGGEQYCWDTVPGGYYRKKISATFNSQLATIGSVSSSKKVGISSGDNMPTGPIFVRPGVGPQDLTTNYYHVLYFIHNLEANADAAKCPVGIRTYADNVFTACAIPLQ